MATRWLEWQCQSAQEVSVQEVAVSTKPGRQ